MNKVFLTIPSVLLEEYSEFDLKIWAKEAIAFLPNIIKYQEKIVVLQVEDYKVQLPSDFRQLLSVYEQYDELTQNIKNQLSCEPSVYNENICKPTSYAKIFLDSLAYQDCFSDIKYIGDDTSLLCKGCVNLCSVSDKNFIIDRKKMIHTNFKEATLCIRYEAMVCDDNGDPVIPDDQVLYEYVSSYMLKKFWLDRATRKEQGAVQMYDRAKQDYDLLLRRARGKYNLMNIEPDTLSTAVFGKLKEWKNAR